MNGLMPEAFGGYGEEERRAVQLAVGRLREGNRPREEGFLHRWTVFGPFETMMPAFNSADDAILRWAEGAGESPVPDEIDELRHEALITFERLYPQVTERARADPDRAGVFAENTWLLALLLLALGDDAGGVRWLSRTLEFERNAAARRETQLKLAEVLLAHGELAKAAAAVDEVLREEPDHEAALGMRARLNP